MGGRLLRQWLLRPLLRPTEIGERLEAVAALVEAPALLADLREALDGIGDLARLASRVALGVATPRDLAALRATLGPLPALRERAERCPDPLVRQCAETVEDLAALGKTLEAALVDEPAVGVHEGGLIRESWSPPLAEVRREVREARAWIAGLEGRERERTGISSLRVRYNRVFGYGIEIPRSQVRPVPEDYVRRQTLVGAERYVTAELREQEAKVLGAEGRMNRLEYELFDELRRSVAAEADRLLRTARAVATLDVLAALAHVARERGYVRPAVDDGGVIEIQEGRHPVIELRTDGARFVPNDLRLASGEVECLVITGPNMAGKSTYMRQVALIVLLAQVGSFVPARSARVGVVDRIFTRIGAQDNLARGHSTFLVEMTETAAILRHATSAEPGPPRRDRPRHVDVRRPLDRLGGGRAPARVPRRGEGALRHALPRADAAGRRAAAGAERARGRPGVEGRHRLPPPGRAGRDRSLVRHPGGSPGRPASGGGRPRAGAPAGVRAGRASPRGAAGADAGQLPLFGRPAAGRPAEPAAAADPASASTPHPVLEALAALDPERLTPIEALTALDELRRRLASDP